MMRLRRWGGVFALSCALVVIASVEVVAQDDKPGKAQAKEADDADELPKALGELPSRGSTTWRRVTS
jgi:hypothetical protein